jgi:hypothetical protein
MLSFNMFVYTEPRSAKLQPRFAALSRSPRFHTVDWPDHSQLVALRTPMDACIPFLFNRSSSLRLRRAPTERYLSPLFSYPCGRFPSQQGGTPPSFAESVLHAAPLPPQSPPVIQPLCFQTLADYFSQWTSATFFLSIACGLFPLPWGCIPPRPSSLSLGTNARTALPCPCSRRGLS